MTKMGWDWDVDKKLKEILFKFTKVLILYFRKCLFCRIFFLCCKNTKKVCLFFDWKKKMCTRNSLCTYDDMFMLMRLSDSKLSILRTFLELNQKQKIIEGETILCALKIRKKLIWMVDWPSFLTRRNSNCYWSDEDGWVCITTSIRNEQVRKRTNNVCATTPVSVCRSRMCPNACKTWVRHEPM